MSFTDRFAKWSSIIRDWFIILVIAGGLILMALSLWANVAENKAPDDGIPDYPSISKAQWEVTINNTGNVLLTNEYEHPTDNLYILHGYYEIQGKKYKYRDVDLPLDEDYFGPIIVERRTE